MYNKKFMFNPPLGRRGLLKGLPAGAAALSGLTALDMGSAHAHGGSADLAREITKQYLIEFYPLWFTFYQSQIGGQNRLAGPLRVTPIYMAVVAINVDTIYTSGFVHAQDEPAVLTVPDISVSFSVLLLDRYGNTYDSGIKDPGGYVLKGPDYTGQLPVGPTVVDLPDNFPVLIFRADKFDANGQDKELVARAFRRELKLQSLSDYSVDPTGGGTLVLPEVVYGIPFKTAADELIRLFPVFFLRQLQAAVESPVTPPLSTRARDLADEFNKLLADILSIGEAPFEEGAQKAHQMLIDNYVNNTGETNWVTFNDIGAWADDEQGRLDRASISEFIQYANSRDTSAYYQAFLDRHGNILDGSHDRGYVLTFKVGEEPEASRFWSLTAYTPEAIELIENDIGKYAVASYTPGLQKNPSGSISIYMAQHKPRGVPEANWLPVSDREFSVMLRVYGPEGSVAERTYVPPGIKKN